MLWGSVRRSDPGQEAAPSPDARPVALVQPDGRVGDVARFQALELRQLRQHCQDLDGFAQALAHELRSPLSAIDGYITLIEEELRSLERPQAEQVEKAQSVEQARRWSSRLREAAQQMGQLIEAAEVLAQVSHAALQPARVDLSGLALGIVQRLAQQHPQPPIQATVEPGLQVQGDPRLLALLMENLLGNARKFSSRKAQVQMEVGAQALPGGRTAFFVRDHGAGFDSARAEHLFEPHRRLHRADEFAGSGLGLALARRIVERHGGQISAQSQPGQGATFYFTWTIAEDGAASAQQGA